MSVEWDVVLTDGLTSVRSVSETFDSEAAAVAAFEELRDFWTSGARIGPVDVALKLERWDGRHRTRERFERIHYQF